MSRVPPSSGKPDGAVQALVKAEKLTQIAFVLPIAVAAGWLAGVLADRLFHQHWIYIVGLVLGTIAGFAGLFRMIAEPGLLAATAYDPSLGKGPGYEDESAGPGGKDS